MRVLIDSEVKEIPPSQPLQVVRPPNSIEDCFCELESVELSTALAQQEAFESGGWVLVVLHIPKRKADSVFWKASFSGSMLNFRVGAGALLVLPGSKSNTLPRWKLRLREAQVEMEMKHDVPWQKCLGVNLPVIWFGILMLIPVVEGGIRWKSARATYDMISSNQRVSMCFNVSDDNDTLWCAALDSFPWMVGD